MTTAYGLLNIIIKGQTVAARPIEWDKPDHTGHGQGRDGVELNPTKYVTTCPHCSQLLMFSPTELYISNNMPLNLMCTECGVGGPKSQNQTSPDMSMTAPDNEPIVVFRDPIAEGLLSTDNYA